MESLDRKTQGDFLRAKFKEIDEFCKNNGIDCDFSFGGGWESKGSMKTVGDKIVCVSEKQRSYTCIKLKIILSDSDKGDYVGGIVENIVNYLLENIKPKEDKQ